MSSATVSESRLATSIERHAALIGCILGGVLFTAVFAFGYRLIDPGLYENRDDGIITLSHARNWVEYGSIGVNPSGERVEGFSSPLQFLVFTAVYGVTGMHYAPYFRIVAYLSAFAMGFLLYRLLYPSRMLGLFVTLVAAIALAYDASFFEWHASGMENALTHAFFLLAVVLLVRQFSEGRVRYGYAIPIFLASIARIESIYHMAPLLAIFAVAWYLVYRNPRGAGFAALAVAIWLVFFVARWWYFGAVFPNTAGAQNISISDRVLSMLTFDWPFIRHSFGISVQLFQWHHGLALLPAAACLPFLRWDRRTALAVLLLASLVLTGLFSPFLFGAARLDVTRLSTQVALAAIALAAVAAVHVRRPSHRFATVPMFLAGIGFMLYWSVVTWEHRPYYLWFSEDVFAEFRDKLIALRDEHGIHRPTVANPDLGLISWHKDFNIVDLGYLGNPALTRLDAARRPSKRDIANYFFDIAAPDLIEIHGIWSERHAHLFKDPRFHERYQPARSHVDGFLQRRFRRDGGFRAEYGPYVRAGYWVRRDMMAGSRSAERQLMEDLRETVSLERLEAELEDCAASNLAPDEAYYVVRTAYRFLPEFARQGEYDALVEMFERYQSSLHYSTALLRGRESGAWAEELVDYVKAYGPGRIRAAMARRLEAANLSLHGRGADTEIAEELWLTGCHVEDAGDGWGRLLLHFECDAPVAEEWKIYAHGLVSDEGRERLPTDMRDLEFVNWDPGYIDPPTSEWHGYGAVVYTQYVRNIGAVDSVRVGLHRPGEGVFGGPVVLPLGRNAVPVLPSADAVQE